MSNLSPIILFVNITLSGMKSSELRDRELSNYLRTFDSSLTSLLSFTIVASKVRDPTSNATFYVEVR